MIKHARTIAACGATLALGLTLGLSTMDAPSDQAIAAGIGEDTAAWNCHTMGNLSCGDALTVPGEDGTTGAVLPATKDGGPTVAWSNGPVSDAPRWYRYVAWRQCVETATGGDASMAACDGAWQYAGERFDMSEAHCYAEAWINDDPDARMLAVCDA